MVPKYPNNKGMPIYIWKNPFGDGKAGERIVEVIMESVSAFSNTKGGILIIGDTGEDVGVGKRAKFGK